MVFCSPDFVLTKSGGMNPRWPLTGKVWLHTDWDACRGGFQTPPYKSLNLCASSRAVLRLQVNMAAPELDIVIPVYDEGENIVATLAAIAREVRTPTRVLLVYDMPEDNTLAAVERHRGEFGVLQIDFLQNRSRGAHAAVMTGFAASKAPHVLVVAADDDYNAGILDAMVARGKDGADIVCASRFMLGGSMVGCPVLKAVLVRAGSWSLRHVARIPTHDASNGFRLF